MSTFNPGDRIECKNGKILTFRSPLEEDEMIQAVLDAVEMKRRDYPNMPKTIEVRAHVRVANGAHNGYGYLFVSDSVIGYWLLGLDSKGKTLEEEIDDPNWTDKTEEELKQRLDELKMEMETKTNSVNWGAFSSLETETATINNILTKKQYPKVRRQLPPFLKLPTLECSEYQIEVMQGLARHKLEEKGKEIEVPDEDGMYDHIFSPAHAYTPPEYFLHNQLITAVDVPDGVSIEDIRKYFEVFTTVKHATINGREMHYPHVTEKEIRGDRKIIVEFCPRSTDAIFAMLFVKCFELKVSGKDNSDDDNDSNDGNEEEVELRFAFNRKPPSKKNTGRNGRGGYRGNHSNHGRQSHRK